MHPLSNILVIQGVTGSGKSDLAYSIAKEENGVIIRADSRQIYKYADIGTNKSRYPDIEVELIDIKEPDETYSAYQFALNATEIIQNIIKRGKKVIIEGGTAYYINMLTGNIPEVDLVLQTEHADKTVFEIQELFQRELPEAYNKLNNSERHNPQRLLKNYSKAKQRSTENSRTEKFLPEAIVVEKVAIQISMEKLTENLIKRTSRMMHDGLTEEAAWLVERYGLNTYTAGSIGYREFYEFIEKTYGVYDKDEIAKQIRKLTDRELHDIESLIALHNRQYAKRQMTWLKKDREIRWIEAKS